MKYCVIGMTKCGTTSLYNYLKSQGHDVVKYEQLFTRRSGFDFYIQELIQYRPIVILRKPEDRRRSYMIEYMERKPKDEGGELPLISYWMSLWKNINLMIVDLEQMKLNPNFPHLNRSIPN